MLRVEDIDLQRCKSHFLPEMVEDLQWFGFDWEEGYQGSLSKEVSRSLDDQYIQSKRFHIYSQAWLLLYQQGYIYPCTQSRRDVEHALSAPHDAPVNKALLVRGDIHLQPEVVFPPELRPSYIQDLPFAPGNNNHLPPQYQNLTHPTDVKVNWRFRVLDCNEQTAISFIDGNFGPQTFYPGLSFGDFLVWRLDGYPSYELAVVVDDILMGISEVVRGEDLLLATARQLLLMQAIFGLDYRNLDHWQPQYTTQQEVESEEKNEKDDGTITMQSTTTAEPLDINNVSTEPPNISGYRIPQYFHAPLMCDESGRRMAKRDLARSLRKMREDGMTVDEIKLQYFTPSLL